MPGGYRDHVDDTDVLVEWLRDCEALVLIRERTAIRTRLLERLPRSRRALASPCMRV